MKLKRVKKHLDDSWQKCCRWCSYYENGKCFNKSFNIDTTHIEKVAEEGHLNETLEEVLRNHSLSQFKELECKLRDWKVSEKRIKEFNDLFVKCYEEWVNEAKEDLDYAISLCYDNNLETYNGGVVISDPENYCCKEWC